MGRFGARLAAAIIVGISLLASQAGLASPSQASPVSPVAAQGVKPKPAAAPHKTGAVPGTRAKATASIGQAILPGFTQQTLPANDDGSTGLVPLPFPVNFYGATYESLYVNNNGNLTFTEPLSQYTPQSLNQIGFPMIAPFWADVDTRVGQTVTYGYGTVGGHPAFGVDYENVGCYDQIDSVTDTFQVVLIDRPDLGTGNWQIEFNYGPLTWDSGQASGGDSQCLGGSPARAGYTSGVGPSCELPGSGVSGGLLDTDPITGLEYNEYGSSTPGRYIFNVSGTTGTPNGCGSYFAIGDSYSSGEGTNNYNYAGAPCDRGSNAWPALLSAEYAAVPMLSPDTFVACSGATTAEQAPQVTALQNWTNSNGPPGLVTLTAGGDDLGFSNVLKTCVAGSFLGDDGTSCLAILAYEVHVLNSDSFFDRMTNFYESVAEAAGGPSNVVVVGYPNLFPLPSLGNDLTAAANCFIWMRANSPQILAAFAYAQSDLNDVLASAALAAHIRFVRLGDLFADHELCTGDAWINALRPFYSGAGHPNIAGQQAIAGYVASQLGYLEGNGAANAAGQRGSAGGSATMKGTAVKHPGRAAASGRRPSRSSETTGAVTRAASVARSGAATPITLSAGLTSGWVGVPYTGFLWGSGGTGPFTWSVTTGSLPAGLSLDPSTGIISGTPTGAGTTTFTVKATDSGSPAQTASETVSITTAATTALSVTTSSLPAPTAGQAYSTTLAATGGVPVYSWSVSSGTLPAGLSLDPDTGTISGTPATSGSSTFTVQASDSASPTAHTATKTLTLSVVAAAATLTLVPPTLPGATAGGAYTAPLASTGGTAPLAWSVSTGTLPPGLSLDPAAGVISGIPTQPGTFSFGVSVSDAAAHTATESLSITVAAGTAPSVATSSLPGATAGSAYSQQLIGTGGVPDYTWSVTAGTLPAGLSLDPSSGIISGTPTTAGGYSFTVTLTDSATPIAATATAAYTVTVAPSPASPAFTVSDTTTSGVVGLPYSASLITANGTSPYTFTVTSGALPPGLSVDPSLGVISGTPTTAGTFTATTGVTDSSSPTPQTASDMVTITITMPGTLAVTTTSVPDGAVGAGYAVPVVAAGGTGTDTFAVTSGTLPAGLTLDPASGIIYGVPTASGPSTFTVTVTDSATPAADTATATLTLTVDGTTPVSIATTSLPSPTQGVAYSQILAASGGTQPYSWSVTSGALPAGLSLNATTGVLSGTPTGSGPSTFTVTVTDSSSPTAQTATHAYTMTVYGSGTLAITSTTLNPDTASEGVPYSTTLDASGGTEPYSWAVTSGALPPGLSLDSVTGAITGTPTSGGAFPFTVTVTDSTTPTAQTASQSYTLTVAAPVPLAITTTSLPAATVNTAYSAAVAVTGGTTPYTWSVSAGSLPPGLSLDSATGAISGTPTTAGPFDFSVQVTDSSASTQTATAALAITVAPALLPQSISFTAPSSGTVGGTAALTATGGASGKPVVFSVDPSSGAGVCSVSGTNGATLHYTGAGNCVVDANQAGDANYLPAPQVQATIPVAKAATSTTLSLSAATVAWDHEKAVTFTVKVTSPSAAVPGGVVTVAAGTRTLCTGTLSAGVATCTPGSATLLAPGSYSVTASYPGSSGFTGSKSAAATLKVTRETTKAALSLSASSVTYGHEKSLVVTVTVAAQYAGTPAGTVTITAGHVTLCKNKVLTRGKATCSPASGTTLTAGTYSVVASYSGNADFAASTSPAKILKVVKATAITSALYLWLAFLQPLAW